MKQKLLLLFTLCSSFLFNSNAQIKKEAIASAWLNKNKQILEIQDNHSFEMLYSRAGFSGETFRYYQMLNNVQVFDAEITIHVSNNNQVTYYASTYDKTVISINTFPQISKTNAYNIAKDYINLSGNIAFNKQQLFIYNNTLAYVIIIEPQTTPIGSWEIVVNAQTGEVISALNKAVYYKDYKKLKKEKQTGNIMLANGSGFVFETDPLTATGNIYGGDYIDNNDATNAALNAARTSVVLLDITQTSGQFFLTGPFAEIQDFETPNKGLFSQVSSAFNFNRNQDGFEAVNAYYHIDKSMRYINNTLGVNLTPLEYSTGVRIDPSGLNGSDNSQYLPGSNRLSFGEGCVDDAEDADVLLHELGHGIHDWLTNGSMSTIQGLSEGCGDYWANSYKRSLGLWQITDESYYYVFGWDGHSDECWPGRTTNYQAQYPYGIVGGSGHIDGQMWATTLLEIWEDIGREKTDLIFLEGLAMTNSGSNQQDAAIAVMQAAIDIGELAGFTSEDIEAIKNRFIVQGYILDPSNIMEDEQEAITIYPNPTNGVLIFKNVYKAEELFIYNILGQKVKNNIIDATNNIIDVSKLSSGTYFVKFNTEDTVLKFIKE